MKIAVTDDEQLALESLAKAVKTAAPQAEIAAFKDPYDFLEYAKTNKCDVAFLDIKMRGTSGIEVAKQLKLISPKMNVVFVTGYDSYMAEAFGLHASGYILKPVTAEAVLKELENLRNPIEIKSSKRIKIQTFGNFEVFCDGAPVEFLRSRSKEILAFLVDKNGTSVTPAELACIIWEDGLFDRSRQKQMQNYICDLQKSLAAVGAEDIIIKKRNCIMADKTKFDCDLYRFLEGDPSAINSYTGQYMYAYSWAEITASFLELRNN